MKKSGGGRKPGKVLERKHLPWVTDYHVSGGTSATKSTTKNSVVAGFGHPPRKGSGHSSNGGTDRRKHAKALPNSGKGRTRRTANGPGTDDHSAAKHRPSRESWIGRLLTELRGLGAASVAMGKRGIARTRRDMGRVISILGKAAGKPGKAIRSGPAAAKTDGTRHGKSSAGTVGKALRKTMAATGRVLGKTLAVSGKCCKNIAAKVRNSRWVNTAWGKCRRACRHVGTSAKKCIWSLKLGISKIHGRAKERAARSARNGGKPPTPWRKIVAAARMSALFVLETALSAYRFCRGRRSPNARQARSKARLVAREVGVGAAARHSRKSQGIKLPDGRKKSKS